MRCTAIYYTEQYRNSYLKITHFPKEAWIAENSWHMQTFLILQYPKSFSFLLQICSCSSADLLSSIFEVKLKVCGAAKKAVPREPHFICRTIRLYREGHILDIIWTVLRGIVFYQQTQCSWEYSTALSIIFLQNLFNALLTKENVPPDFDTLKSN